MLENKFFGIKYADFRLFELLPDIPISLKGNAW